MFTHFRFNFRIGVELGVDNPTWLPSCRENYNKQTTHQVRARCCDFKMISYSFSQNMIVCCIKCTQVIPPCIDYYYTVNNALVTFQLARIKVKLFDTKI